MPPIEIIIRYTFEWCGRANFTLRENMKNCFERINYILLVKGKMSLLILSFVCLMSYIFMVSNTISMRLLNYFSLFIFY